MSFFGSDLATSQVSDDLLGFLGKKKILPDEIVHQEESLSVDFLKLLNNKDYSNFTYLIGKDKKPIYVHKTILQSRCKESKTLEKILKSSDFLISDIEYDDFLEFLKYIYTGTCSFSLLKSSIFLQLSDSYSLKELKSLIMETAFDNLEIDNACLCYSLFYKEKYQQGISKAKKLIEENAFIILPDQIHFLEDKMIEELIQSNELAISEIDLFNLLSKNYKDKYLKYIRFGLIESNDLENIVFPSDLLSNDLKKLIEKKDTSSYLFKERVNFSNSFQPLSHNLQHYSISGNKFTRSNNNHYANLGVYSNILPPKIYIEIKIIKVVQVVGYSVGIAKTKGNSYEKDICVSPSGSRYNCTGSGSINCSQGDSIGLDFDKSRGTLSFFLNGKETGIYSNLDKTTNYFACVHTRSPNDSFEIYIKPKPKN